ncbi:hypothetical protein X740_07895 [Mesorhizobium sp. LNHC221B00]|uniref:DUF6074 family protein n=1 Tax=Mesorhizobium sp. LNHC221B00 TaxID=1287233 RepID=UPI0003CF97EC|nr:DUF6074 family protein [Mesorhizobium sp. LNHC221B00]ESY81888.1 hypothetical protein X740_07895 [Mesorhizobium sp. LNHC221B00]
MKCPTVSITATATVFAFPVEKQIGLIRRTVDVLDAKCAERTFGEPYLQRAADKITRRLAAAGVDEITIAQQIAAFRKAVDDESLRRLFDNFERLSTVKP